LALGRLVKRKGFSRLIEIAPDLLKLEKALKFVIVGPDGGYGSILREMTHAYGVEGNVVFTGQISSSMVGEAISTADVAVFPSEYEGTPTALLEAFSYGKPVVATRVGGMEDVVEHMKDGVSVNLNNPSLADGIRLLLQNPTLAAQLGRNARIKVRKYDWKILVTQVLDIYREALDSRLE
jgi:glycosyltransferase involved in cell wall biosynthesis